MAKKLVDLSSIEIEKLIIHDIPKRLKKDDSVKPQYSEQECIISDGLKPVLKDKIINALSAQKAFKICFDSTKTSPVPIFIKDLLNGEVDNYINYTQRMADHLLLSQDGLNTAGILLIIHGKISKENTCIIMKLERDRGMQLKLNPLTKSFDIEDVEDLMLTQKTKIFKVALFLNKDVFKLKYDGLLTDYQIDMKAKKEIQTFFLSDFLGCSPFEDPKFTTQKFYNLTRTFIDSLEDEIEKAQCVQDLNSYIQKNQNTVSPREFAEDYLKTPERQNGYKKYMQDKKFTYNTAFMKDTALIDSKIKKIAISFANGISIIGAKGIIDDKVVLQKITSGEHNGEHRAEIISRITKIS